MPEPDDPSWPAGSHFDARGQARMVDVGAKPATERSATARAVLRMNPQLRDRLLAGGLAKGDALATARIAGIQGAKETARLIPLCHPLPLTAVEVDLAPLEDDGVTVTATARCVGPTGVEMEAMTAAAVAALTLYDMTKGMQRDVRITEIVLLHKAGGRSGEWRRPEER